MAIDVIRWSAGNGQKMIDSLNYLIFARMNHNKIQEIINESVAVKNKVLQDQRLIGVVGEVVTLIVDRFREGKHLYFCGNGGSAADAQHLAAEFSGRFYINRDALPAEALHCNTSYLTAVANDFSYELIYSRLINSICKPQH